MSDYEDKLIHIKRKVFGPDRAMRNSLNYKSISALKKINFKTLNGVTFLCGAGVSMASGFPGWWELLAETMIQINKSDKFDDNAKETFIDKYKNAVKTNDPMSFYDEQENNIPGNDILGEITKITNNIIKDKTDNTKRSWLLSLPVIINDLKKQKYKINILTTNYDDELTFNKYDSLIDETIYLAPVELIERLKYNTPGTASTIKLYQKREAIQQDNNVQLYVDRNNIGIRIEKLTSLNYDLIANKIIFIMGFDLRLEPYIERFLPIAISATNESYVFFFIKKTKNFMTEWEKIINGKNVVNGRDRFDENEKIALMKIKFIEVEQWEQAEKIMQIIAGYLCCKKSTDGEYRFKWADPDIKIKYKIGKLSEEEKKNFMCLPYKTTISSRAALYSQLVSITSAKIKTVLITIAGDWGSGKTEILSWIEGVFGEVRTVNLAHGIFSNNNLLDATESDINQYLSEITTDKILHFDGIDEIDNNKFNTLCDNSKTILFNKNHSRSLIFIIAGRREAMSNFIVEIQDDIRYYETTHLEIELLPYSVNDLFAGVFSSYLYYDDLKKDINDINNSDISNAWLFKDITTKPVDAIISRINDYLNLYCQNSNIIDYVDVELNKNVPSIEMFQTNWGNILIFTDLKRYINSVPDKIKIYESIHGLILSGIFRIAMNNGDLNTFETIGIATCDLLEKKIHENERRNFKRDNLALSDLILKVFVHFTNPVVPISEYLNILDKINENYKTIKINNNHITYLNLIYTYGCFILGSRTTHNSKIRNLLIRLLALFQVMNMFMVGKMRRDFFPFNFSGVNFSAATAGIKERLALSRSNFYRGYLCGASFTDMDFDSISCLNAIFDRSALENCLGKDMAALQSVGREIKFLNQSNFEAAAFTRAKYNFAEFKGNDVDNPANFSSTNFLGASCRAATFSNVTLENSSINYADFAEATFTNVTFSGAIMIGTNFSGCFFKDCKFDYAHIADSIFRSCRFINCKFHKEEDFAGPATSGANTTATEVRLKHKYAKLIGVTFQCSVFTDTSIELSETYKCDFSGCRELDASGSEKLWENCGAFLPPVPPPDSAASQESAEVSSAEVSSCIAPNGKSHKILKQLPNPNNSL